MSDTRVRLARRKAILTRHYGPDHPETLSASREHAYVAIEEYVAEIVSKAPPLTEAQKARISALLEAA